MINPIAPHKSQSMGKADCGPRFFQSTGTPAPPLDELTRQLGRASSDLSTPISPLIVNSGPGGVPTTRRAQFMKGTSTSRKFGKICARTLPSIRRLNSSSRVRIPRSRFKGIDGAFKYSFSENMSDHVSNSNRECRGFIILGVRLEPERRCSHPDRLAV